MLLDGGSLYISESQYPEFQAAYARDIANGHFHYCIERATPVFRWYADLDMEVAAELPREALVRIGGVAAGVLRAAEPLGSPVIILTAPCKAHPAVPRLKQGVHLIAPELRVDAQRAVSIRQELVAALTTALPEALLAPWDDASSALPNTPAVHAYVGTVS